MKPVFSPNDPSTRLKQHRIVLVETSHPGNVGAVARAMKTMGMWDLRLVNPRFADVLTQPDAQAFASGATDVLAQARVVSDLASAVGDCQWTIAMTSRDREYGPPVLPLRTVAEQCVLEPSGTQVAWVFGSERYGLSNEQVQACQRRCTIDTNPEYASLNLAQAVQLVAYECRQALFGQTERLSPAIDVVRATQTELAQLLDHLEQAMIAVQFLDPQQPKKLLPRLQRLLARADLEQEEIHILRGLCRAMIAATHPCKK